MSPNVRRRSIVAKTGRNPGLFCYRKTNTPDSYETIWGLLFILIHRHHCFNRFAVGHVFVGLVVQTVSLGENSTWVDVAFENGIEQNFLIIGCDRSRATTDNDILSKG